MMAGDRFRGRGQKQKTGNENNVRYVAWWLGARPQQPECLRAVLALPPAAVWL